MSFSKKAAELIDWVRVCYDWNKMDILPVWVIDSARLNEKRPANLTMAVPDDYVKNMNGLDPQDVYLFIKIPHEVHEEFVGYNKQPDAIKKATGIFIEETWNKEPVA